MSPSQPPQSPIPLTKATDAQRSICFPYRNGQEDLASVLWLLPFFLFLSRHVVCAVECLDRAQGFGTRFRPLLQTHVACMQRATSDMFARAQTLAEDAADCDTDVVGTVCSEVFRRTV